MLPLEPRILLDAAAVASAASAPDDGAEGSAADPKVTELNTPAPIESQNGEQKKPSDTFHDPQEISEPNPGQATEVIFIDTNVDDYQDLITAVQTDADIILINSNDNGVLQIADALSHYANGSLQAIHIVTHGDAGLLQLGNETLTNNNLQTYSESLAQWGAKLSDNADVLFYGCNVAEGEVGEQFLQALDSYLTADLAASTNLTGTESLGGDWILEYQDEGVQTVLPFSTSYMSEHYTGILADFEIEISDVTEAEGSSPLGATRFQFMITSTGTVPFPVIVSYSVDFGSTDASDFSTFPSSGTVSLDGSRPETVQFSVAHDSDVEPDEQFFVNLSFPEPRSGGSTPAYIVSPDGGSISPPGGGVAFAEITDSQGVGTIQNDDAITATDISVNDVLVNEAAGTLSFTVTSSSALGSIFSVDYSLVDGTAMAPGDYDGTGGVVAFPGERINETATIIVPIVNDTLVEADEVFTVVLSNPNMSGVNIVDDTGIGTIANDDSATISIDDVATAEGNTGATNYDFTVSLSNPVAESVTVNYSTQDGSATTADNDYLPVINGSVTFAPGDTSKTITIQGNGDTKAELNESFSVMLSQSTTVAGVSIGDGTGIGTIQNDDSGVSVTDATVVEGNPGSANMAVFTVLNTIPNTASTPGMNSGPVTIQYSTFGNAQNINDYAEIAGQVVFTAPNQTMTISVPITGDLNVETNEQFPLNVDGDALMSVLREFTPVYTGIDVMFIPIGAQTATGTITNDDSASISINDVFIKEGDGTGTTDFVFDVTLNNAVDGGFTVDYATANHTLDPAMQPVDYNSAMGMLTFAGNAGEVQQITVQVNRDDLPEQNENFQVNLSNISNLKAGIDSARVTIADLQGMGTILNDDVEISIGDVTRVEGTGSSFTPIIFSLTVAGQIQPTDPLVTIKQEVDFGGNFTADVNDFVSLPTTVTIKSTAFDPGFITYSIVQDSNIEFNETFGVNISLHALNQNPDAVIIDSQAVGTIVNDDNGIIISDATVVEGNVGGTNMAVFDVLNASPNTAAFGGFGAGPVSVNFTTTDDTAQDGVDFTAQSGALTFTQYNQVQQISVPIIGETLVENDENFQVQLTSALYFQNVFSTPPTVDISSQIIDGTGAGTITNDDSAMISINNVSKSEGNSGTTNYEFTVTLDNAVQGGFTVDYTTADGVVNPATSASGDYNNNSGMLTFAGTAGETQTITIEINGDSAVEVDEQFLVNLSNITLNNTNIDPSTVSFADAQGLGTIENDDIATVSVSNVSLTESNMGQKDFQFEVTLDKDVTSAWPAGFTVDFTTQNGSATTADNDYMAATGTLTFTGTAGEVQTVTVKVNGDMTVELDESFTVQLSNLSQVNPPTVPTAGAPFVQFSGGGAMIEATGIIENDDAATISISDLSMNEGNAGTTPFEFMVNLSNPVSQPVTVNYSTGDNSASSPSDYMDAMGSVTFTPGSTSETITIQVNGDMDIEFNEQFSVFISPNALPANVSIIDGMATGTIVNDDSGILINDINVSEDNGVTAPTAQFSVINGQAIGQPFSVNYNVASGTATSGVDFTATSGTLNFTGTTDNEVLTIDVPIISDTIVEMGDEQYFVNLSLPAASSGLVTLVDAQGEGVIKDNDSASISINEVFIKEGDGTGTTDFVFDVTLDNAVDGGFTVDYATADHTSEPAMQPDDYNSAMGTLTFAGNAGEVQQITVQVNRDDMPEQNERFQVNLSNIDNLKTNIDSTRVTIADGQGIGHIINDDVEISISDASVVEGTGAGVTFISFMVAVDGFVNESIAIEHQLDIGGSFTANMMDLSSPPASSSLLLIDPTFSSGSVSYLIIPDSNIEFNETFGVTLTGFAASNENPDVVIVDNQAVGTIVNDDNGIIISDATVVEGNPGDTTVANFQVLGAVPGRTYAVSYGMTSDTAMASSDFIGQANALVFNTFNQIKTINVDIVEEKIVEADEQFTAILISAVDITGQFVNIDQFIIDNTGIGTIINDDSATISIDDVSKKEGDAGTTDYIFTVTLDNPVQGGFSVDYATANGAVNPATSASGDYTNKSGTLTFAGTAGETQTITIEVNGDLAVEVDEQFLVNLSNITLNNTNIDPSTVSFADAQGLGTIENDDIATVSVSNVSLIESNMGQKDFQFDVTLDKDVTSAWPNGFTVDFTTQNGSATTADNDYMTAAGTLTFAGTAGEVQTVTVKVNGDVTVELDESFTVQLSNLSQVNPPTVPIAGSPFVQFSGGGTMIEATGIIVNDDAAIISINDVSMAEGSLVPGPFPSSTAFTFDVTLSNPVDQAVTVNYATSDLTALLSNSDYFSTSGMLTFAPGETAQQITVFVLGDGTIEFNEQFAVNLTLPTPVTNVSLDKAQGLGTIVNDDVGIIISDAMQVEGNVGDANVLVFDVLSTFTGSSNNLSPDIVRVNYETVAGTAMATTDFTSQSGVLTFNVSNDVQQIIVPIVGETVVELNEQLTVQLTSATIEIFQFGSTGTVLVPIAITDSTGVGTIINDDSGITISDATIVEGNPGDNHVAVFDVISSIPNAATMPGMGVGPVTVVYATMDDTALSASDYTPETMGTLTFTEPLQVQQISVPITGELVVEADEQFKVNLINASQMQQDFSTYISTVINPSMMPTLPVDLSGQIQNNTGIATIINDDSATISINDISKKEGDAGTTDYIFTVTLDNPVQGGFSVDYATANGSVNPAEQPGDYTQNSGTLHFAGNAGETQTITVKVNGDLTPEEHEQFLVNLMSLTLNNTNIDPSTVTIADAQGVGTVLNDDVEVRINDAFIVEGTGGGPTNAVFTVSLLGALTDNVIIDHALDVTGGLTADLGDFAMPPTPDMALTFTPQNAATPQMITYQVLQDSTPESNEIFAINLSLAASNPNSDATLVDSQGDGVIFNDDTNLSIDDVMIVEGDSGTTNLVFTVTNANAVFEGFNDPADFAVKYVFSNGTATAPGDFTAMSGILGFAGDTNGETQTIIVPIIGDETVEPDEQFTVTLSQPENGGAFASRPLIFSDDTGVGTIKNDDIATISLSSVTQLEGDVGQSNFEFEVTLDKDITALGQAQLSMDFLTMGGSAIPGIDYVGPTNGTISFVGNANEVQTFNVVVNGDLTVESNEQFIVELRNLLLQFFGTSTPAGGPFVQFDGGATSLTSFGTILDDDSATLSVGDAQITEGNAGTTQVTVPITLSNPVEGGLTILVNTMDGMGPAAATAANLDYVPIFNQQVVFAGNQVNEVQNVQITINGDVDVEFNETFKLIASGLFQFTPTQMPGASPVILSDAELPVTLLDDTGEITILNDDIATLTINDVTITEGDGSPNKTVTFTTTLDKAVPTSFTVDFDTDSGTAAASIDFGPILGQLGDSFGRDPLMFTGMAGEQHSRVVTVFGETLVELDEAFTFKLSNIVGNNMLPGGPFVQFDGGVSTLAGTANIINDDGATISIDDVSMSEGDSGTTLYNFTVSLSQPVDTPVTVDFVTAQDTARTDIDSDFVPQTGSVTFDFNSTTSQTITIEVNGDEKVELDESFNVNLSNIQAMGRNVTFSDSQGRGTIVNDDAASLSINDVAMFEGDMGTQNFTFNVTLDKDVDTGFSVDFSTSDALPLAMTGVDYQPLMGTLNFSGMAGEVQTINITVNGDEIVEHNEAFNVDLNSVMAMGRNVGFADAQGLGTIINDDSTQLSIGDAVVTEGNSGNTLVNVPVTLSHPIDGGMNVLVNTIDGVGILGATTANGDYLPIVNGILPFTGTQVNEVINVQLQVVGDLNVEPNETFNVVISGGGMTQITPPSLNGISYTTINGMNNGMSTGMILPVIFNQNNLPINVVDDTGEVTILNDDIATLSVADVSLAEGDGPVDNILSFTVTLDKAVPTPFTVDLSLAGLSAQAGVDFVPVTTSPIAFTGLAGEQQVVQVQIIGETLVEADETLQLILNNISESNALPGNPFVQFAGAGDSLTATGTILNDDSATVSIGDVTQTEGDSGQTLYNFTVSLTDPVDASVTVNYATLDNTARIDTDTDYKAQNGTVMFAANSNAAQIITIAVNGDEKVELNETFNVNLSNLQASGRAVTVADAQGVGTINNDDTARLTINDVSMDEGNPPDMTFFTFTVTSDKAVDVPFTVAFTTTDGTAVAVGDFAAQSGSLTFQGMAGETQTIVVDIVEDFIFEPDEIFTVDLSNIMAQNRSVIFADPQGEGEILDDEEADGPGVSEPQRRPVGIIISIPGETSGRFISFATIDPAADLTQIISAGDTIVSHSQIISQLGLLPNADLLNNVLIPGTQFTVSQFISALTINPGNDPTTHLPVDGQFESTVSNGLQPVNPFDTEWINYDTFAIGFVFEVSIPEANNATEGADNSNGSTETTDGTDTAPSARQSSLDEIWSDYDDTAAVLILPSSPSNDYAAPARDGLNASNASTARYESFNDQLARSKNAHLAGSIEILKVFNNR